MLIDKKDIFITVNKDNELTVYVLIKTKNAASLVNLRTKETYKDYKVDIDWVEFGNNHEERAESILLFNSSNKYQFYNDMRYKDQLSNESKKILLTHINKKVDSKKLFEIQTNNDKEMKLEQEKEEEINLENEKINQKKIEKIFEL